MHIFIISVFSVFLLTSCASTPDFDTAGVDASLTPKAVVAEIDSSSGKTIIWGGVIISSKNLKDVTQFEVLSYPLDTSHMPLLSNDPQGRFIIRHNGFLETSIFQAGRMVSVLGQVAGSQSGKVGEADYTYPVIDAKTLHLWSRDAGRSRTTFHFGLGVQL